MRRKVRHFSEATFRSTGAEAAVIEGANSITLADAALSSTKEKWGVLIHRSMSGDASGTKGVFTMTGGSISYAPTAGPLFYVTNPTAVITLMGVSVTTDSGILIAVGSLKLGECRLERRHRQPHRDAQRLTGNFVIDSVSSLALTLKNGSALAAPCSGDSGWRRIALQLSIEGGRRIVITRGLALLSTEVLGHFVVCISQ